MTRHIAGRSTSASWIRIGEIARVLSGMLVERHEDLCICAQREAANGRDFPAREKPTIFLNFPTALEQVHQ